MRVLDVFVIGLILHMCEDSQVYDIHHSHNLTVSTVDLLRMSAFALRFTDGV